MSDRKTEYREYLRSEKWKLLRKAAQERANGRCEMCGEIAEHVHHVKYPKVFAEDHIDNLVVVCGSCHAKAHGMRGTKELMEVIPFSTGQVTVQVRAVETDGQHWVCIDDVIQMFCADLPPSLSHGIQVSKTRLEGELRPNPRCPNAPPEFRWMDVEVAGKLRTLRFLNRDGIGRAGMMFPGDRATSIRDWYIDLDRNQRARLANSNEMNADMVENIGQALTWIASQMRQKADVSQVVALENRIYAVEQAKYSLLTAVGTANIVAATAHQYLFMNGLKDDPVKFGIECRRQCKQYGKDPDAVPSLMEGTKPAKVWPIEILSAAATARNLMKQ